MSSGSSKSILESIFDGISSDEEDRKTLGTIESFPSVSKSDPSMMNLLNHWVRSVQSWCGANQSSDLLDGPYFGMPRFEIPAETATKYAGSNVLELLSCSEELNPPRVMISQGTPLSLDIHSCPTGIGSPPGPPHPYTGTDFSMDFTGIGMPSTGSIPGPDVGMPSTGIGMPSTGIGIPSTGRNPSTGIGIPRKPKIPKNPSGDAEDDEEDDKSDGDLKTDDLDDYGLITDLKPLYKRYNRKLGKAIRKQNVFSYYLRQCTSKNAEARNQLNLIPDQRCSGTAAFYALRKYGMNLQDRNEVERHQQRMTQITEMADTAAVAAWLDEYEQLYSTWTSLFVVDASDPRPWTRRISDSLLVRTIMDALPKDPTWNSYRMVANPQFKNQCVEFLLTNLRTQLNMLPSVNANTLPANPAPAVSNGRRGMGSRRREKKKYTGPNFDCSTCKKNGVADKSQREHSPRWFKCPFHPRNKRSERGGKRPSAEHPCSKCGARDHWARECPQAANSASFVPTAREEQFANLLVHSMQNVLQNQYGLRQLPQPPALVHGQQIQPLRQVAAMPMPLHMQQQYNPGNGQGTVQQPNLNYPAQSYSNGYVPFHGN